MKLLIFIGTAIYCFIVGFTFGKAYEIDIAEEKLNKAIYDKELEQSNEKNN